MPLLSEEKRLKKTLTLADVYAIATGAMFSSGFFLLPGLATAVTGPSTVLAYLLAGLLCLPALFSQAELCTAMPRAGGTYYFLDRSLGPLAGTVGGIGTWLSLVFKSAFALVGMGAYLIFFFDLPIKPVAVALTLAFAALNIVGVKETSGFQRFLVAVLVGILAFFVVQGLLEVFSLGVATVTEEQFTPFLPFGTGGLLSTIGLVFVSYAGLTKVASVAEEVQDPDRNIPLGMMLSLGTATLVYVVGVYIVIAVLPATELRADLTPIATAAQEFMGWLPGEILGLSTGVFLIVISALAAFISTGNAGILAASRYPLAMARDRLLWKRFERVGRFQTPTPAILVTSAAMILFIVLFSAKEVAKLASAFNLLVFGLLNLSVIVMRESEIPSYAPGFRSPFYPWMQIAGMIASAVLIATIGALSIAFTLSIILLGIGWYWYYVRGNVGREGAVYHLFERLGRSRYQGLDEELGAILEEKELDENTPFDRLVARAQVLDLDGTTSYEAVARRASTLLGERLPVAAETLTERFLRDLSYGIAPISHGAVLSHYRIPGIEQAELVMVRCRSGLCIEYDTAEGTHERTEPMYALFFLVSPRDHPSRHLRILANLAARIDEAQFLDTWREARDGQQLKEVLLHHERHLSLYLVPDTRTADFIGRPVHEANLPARTLIVLIRRRGQILVPGGGTELEAGDRLTIIGEPAGIRRLHELYGDGR